MGVLERAKERVRGRELRMVFPESHLGRVREAMGIVSRDGLGVPVELTEPSDGQMAALIDGRGVKEAVARRMLSRPLIRGAAMVAAGEADVLIAGAEAPTKKVIEAAGLAIGLARGVALPSSFFVMVFPDGREMIWADCAVNVAPDAIGLAAIARASEASCEALIGPARVAMLSYSSGASGAGESVSNVAEAAELAEVLGPVQGDAALNRDIAGIKNIGQGDANVLIFPSLDAGNIAYKLAQELAGAQAIGPVLQGFSRPVCDLSRGASVSDIVASAVLCAALG